MKIDIRASPITEIFERLPAGRQVAKNPDLNRDPSPPKDRWGAQDDKPRKMVLLEMPIRTLLLSLCILALSASAHAETIRVGLIVGNNQGAADRQVLRFAESDARGVHETLIQIGDFDSRQIFLLTGKNVMTVRRTFDRVRAMVRNFSHNASSEVLFFFYFSGHLQNDAVEFGGETIGVRELRDMILSVPARVRVAILDSCYSGAILRGKGGELDSDFIPVDLDTKKMPFGSVFITSSADMEKSYESKQTQGSFFTHFLLSGMRGSADYNYDGHVTLMEAYSYAAEETLQRTRRQWGKEQHPSYDFQLSGEGEITLTDISRGAPILLLSSLDEGDFYLFQRSNRFMIAEAHKKKGAERRIALPEGSVLIQKAGGNSIFEKEFEAKPHGIYEIDWGQSKKRPFHPPQRVLASLTSGGEKKLLREGELISLRLVETINSRFSNQGDKVSFESLEDIWIDDRLVIPAGAPATGEILSVKKKRGLTSGALICRLGYVQAIDGQRVPLDSIVSRVAHGGILDDPEEELEKPHRSTTAMDIASTAAAVVLLPFYPFMQGRHAIIKEGAVFQAYISRDAWLSGVAE